MRAYPILYQNRMEVILSIFLTIGAGYYWRSGKIGNYLITQRSVDALDEFRKCGHIADRPGDANCPPCVYSTHSILTTISDDVEPDALLAAWEVLNYLDNDPGTEPIEEARAALSAVREYQQGWQELGVDRVYKFFEDVEGDWLENFFEVEVHSSPKDETEEWGVSLQDAETMRNWIMRKQGQELAQRVKKELIQRGLVV
jgi:hypothetical protein